MRTLLVLLLLTGCRHASPDLDVGPVSDADARAFADRFVAAMQPCDEAKVAALFDRDAFAARLALPGAGGTLSDPATSAHILCRWQSTAESYRVLRWRTVDGTPRPLLRRLAKEARSKIVAVAYDELMLGTSPADHQVRIVDVYSYVSGQWLSQVLRGASDAFTGVDDPIAASASMVKAVELNRAGKPTEALAIIDALPIALRNARATQMMRINVANAISREAHEQALTEIAGLFPEDPSIAMVQIDAAMVRGDFDAALHYLDLVDRSVGGDPFQEAVRAEIYLQRKHPGDLDLAAAQADKAVHDEPTLAKGHWSQLDVALARARWAEAIAVMRTMKTTFKAAFEDATLRTSPAFAGLVATPEYAGWLAEQQAP